ncbi:MAG: TlpA family protein disulfide reductase [Methylococcaceae bacterium]|nr:TlpA family protein disulfide reductase [Methylococcaceae bacterium]
MRFRVVLYGMALLALVGGVYTQHSLQRAPAAASGSPLEMNFSFFDLEGRLHRLNEWRGKVLIVNFWASWCPPCVAEMPGFVALQNELGAQGVQFVGLITGDSQDAAKAFLDQFPVNYPILNGEPGANEWSARLGNNTDVLPLSAVFDRDGKLIHMEYGLFKRDEVLKVIGPLLAGNSVPVGS